MRKRKGFLFIDALFSIMAALGTITLFAILYVLFQKTHHNPENVSLFDNNGNVIQQWSNVSYFYSDDSGIQFEADGHRIIVCGGIVIAE